MRDEDGYVTILGRTDDVINVAGHRLGTREIEESLSSHPAIAEVAVVGVADQLKGQVAMAFAIVRDASRVAEAADRLALEGELMRTVEAQLGAVARPARVFFVGALPKTRSGKLLRRAMQAVAEGRDPGDLTTIEDPTALAQVQAAMQSAEGAKSDASGGFGAAGTGHPGVTVPRPSTVKSFLLLSFLWRQGILFRFEFRNPSP